MSEIIRRVRWSQDALDFWEKASDNSVVLQFVVSYGCVSQTEKGFEDLVYTLNDPEFKKKIKKLVITDTSYLYRHCIPDFTSYKDLSLPTIWYLNNEAMIRQLEVPTEFESWPENLKKKEFKEWHDKILLDFNGNGDDSRIVREFRDLVFTNAAVAAYKGGYEIQNCIDFLLEECAYTCAYLQNSTLLYPTPFLDCMANVVKRYNTNVKELHYKTSKHAQKHTKYRDNRFDMLDKEVAIFMREKVSNVNFFVIDKEGQHLYKNYALAGVVGDENAKLSTPESWENSLKVMREKKTMTFEEVYMDKIYFAVKSPFMIDGEVAGVIGLSVDITDSKKIEIEKNKTRELEFLSKLQQVKIKFQDEFVKFISQMAHDITSPLICLEHFSKQCDNLPKDQKELLDSITSSIRSIANDLLEKYKYNKRTLPISDDNYTLMYSAVENVIKQKKLQYNSHVQLNFISSPDSRFCFIKGKSSDFERMISNLMNNAIEASKEDCCITIRMNINDDSSDEQQKLVLCVEDNGSGMSVEDIQQLAHDMPLKSSKKQGFGLGLSQVLETVDMYKGKLEVESVEHKGTKFAVAFPILEKPDNILKEMYAKYN